MSGSITTAYTYSDDLEDPTSEQFQRTAATVESEMTSIMMQSDSVDSVSTRVTSFEPAERRRRREAESSAETSAMAKANFEAVAEVSDDASGDDIGTALEDEIQDAINDGNDVLLGAGSFTTSGKFATRIVAVLFENF